MDSLEACALAPPGYELLERVGEGGMGTVYRARQLSLQRVVAVKVLRLPPDAGQGYRAFQSETRLLASLSHPNVLAIHDCVQSGVHSYLITEFVPGTSLRGQMRSGQPWPVDQAATLLDKVAGALTYIHRHGILHLDLKPENVLCPPEGEIKIADFGLAQPRAEAGRVLDEEQIRGTADYCSLEQLHGLPTDERSDLFSLAVLSYELLTGHLPGRAYRKATEVNPALPPAVDEVLRQGLSRRREHRPGSVEAFRLALAAALRPQTRWVRLAALSALAVVLLTVLAGFFLLRDRSSANQPERQVPRAWLVSDEPDGAGDLAGLGDEEPDAVATVSTRNPVPEAGTGPPLPRWPRPRPVLFVSSGEGSGFFHPLYGVDPARRLLTTWPTPLRGLRCAPEDNFVLQGDFSGRRILEKEAAPWRLAPGQRSEPGDGVDVACPPDRPNDPALLLDKSHGGNTPLVCYQWLSRYPDTPGTLMVLRYRARSEEGTGRLSVGPTMPLHIPHGETGPLAEALRKRSVPHPYLPAQAGMDVREYRIEDWIQPPAEWRTYCVVWEWPPFCTESGGRNVVVEFHGPGKVWLDDVEIFPWETGSTK